MKKMDLLSNIAERYVNFYLEYEDVVKTTKLIKKDISQAYGEVSFLEFEITRSQISFSFQTSQNESYFFIATNRVTNTNENDEIERPEVKYFITIESFLICRNNFKTLHLSSSYEC